MEREAELPSRRRVAHLGFLTVVLFVLALTLLAVTVLVALEVRSNTATLHGHGARAETLLVVGEAADASLVLLAVAAAVAASLVLVAALHSAAEMRVLARDRRIPPPLPHQARRLRTLMLTPLGPETVRLTSAAELPPSQLAAHTELLRRATPSGRPAP